MMFSILRFASLSILAVLLSSQVFADDSKKEQFSIRLIRIGDGDEIRALRYSAEGLIAQDYRFARLGNRIVAEHWQVRRENTDFETQYLIDRFLKRSDLNNSTVAGLDEMIERCRMIDGSTSSYVENWVRLTYIRKGKVIGQERWPVPHLIQDVERLEADANLSDIEKAERLDQIALNYDLSPSQLARFVTFSRALYPHHRIISGQNEE